MKPLPLFDWRVQRDAAAANRKMRDDMPANRQIEIGWSNISFLQSLKIGAIGVLNEFERGLLSRADVLIAEETAKIAELETTT